MKKTTDTSFPALMANLCKYSQKKINIILENSLYFYTAKFEPIWKQKCYPSASKTAYPYSDSLSTVKLVVNDSCNPLCSKSLGRLQNKGITFDSCQDMSLISSYIGFWTAGMWRGFTFDQYRIALKPLLWVLFDLRLSTPLNNLEE